MERGFLLLLGSIVALAIVAAVGAELDPGYQEGELLVQRREPPRFQYLPGEGGRRRTSRRKGGSGRPGSRNRVAAGPTAPSVPPPPSAGEPPLQAPPPPALPQQFAGAFDGDSSAAPGEPGIDYPIYSHIPVTSFSCEGKIAGYYADPETQCQVFHVCTPGGSTSNSFICPNGTLFNPAVRTCDWWPAVDCGSSSESLRLNHVGKKVKDMSEATQSLLGGPGTRIKSQRTHNRQQHQQFRQKFTNEILSQDTYQETGRQSIKFDRRQQHPLEFTETVPTQPPQTTRIAEQYKQKTRQEYNTVVNSGRNIGTRRRPPSSNRLSNQSLKRNQYVRTTTPPASTVGQYTVEETYSPQPITRGPIQQFHWPPLSQTVTRFDITSETLDFPSYRNTPSSTTYRTPTAPRTEPPTLPTIKNSTPVRASGLAPHRTTFSVQDALPILQIATTNPPYTEEKEYKTTRVTTPATPISIPEVNIQPINERLTQPQHLQVSFANSVPSQQPLAPTPIQTTFEVPQEVSYEPTRIVTQATPINIPQLNIHPVNERFTQPQNLQVSFANSVPNQQPLAPTPMQTTFELPQEVSYETTRIVTQATPINIPQITVQPINERFTQPQNLQVSFANSAPNQQHTAPTPIQMTFELPKANVETSPKTEHFFGGGSKTSEQPFKNSIFQNSPTYATYAENERSIRPIVVASPKPDLNTFGSHKNVKAFPSGFMASQPILESFQPLTAEDLPSQSNSTVKDSTTEERQGFPSSVAASVAQSFAKSNAGQSGSAAEDFGISQAFAHGSAFSGDLQYSGGEDFTPFFTGQVGLGNHGLPGFNEPQILEKEETNLAPENTEFGPFSSNFAQSFATADSFVADEGFKQTIPVATTEPSTPPPKATTFRPLSLVTVKATARPTTTTIKPVYTPTVPQTTARPTTPSSPKLVTTTTARPITTVYVPSTDTLATSSTPRPVHTTTNSFQASTTTKKPKGFYITKAPATRPSTVQQPLQKDEAPKDNALSKPSNAYLPNPPKPSISPDFSPSLFYQPTRPSFIGVPNSYFRSPTNTQYSSVSTDNLSPEVKTQDGVLDSGLGIDSVEAPIKSTSFEIKTGPDHFKGLGFMLNPLATYDHQSQHSFNYQPPPKFNQKNETEQQISNLNQRLQGATEPPFVIQKSVELFAAHEVAFHPSVFSQTPYTLSSLKGDHSSGKYDQSDLQPPPYLVPSSKARGFGNWNLDEDEEKRTPEES